MSSKTNVVHVTQYLEIGGLESFILEFSKLMDRRAFNVRVLCLNACDDNYRKSLEECGIAVDLIRKRSKYDLGFLRRTASFLRENGTDVVHAHGGCFLYSALMAKMAGVKKIVFTAHGMPVVNGLKAWVEEMLATLLTDNIIAVSAEIAYCTKSRVKVFDHKIEVITNGINHLKYRPCTDADAILPGKLRYGIPPDRKVIGSVGRLEKVKNYAMLLRAVAELVHVRHDEVHLVLVGDGSQELALKDLARELSVSGHVSFLGMQYDLPGIYPLFDLFALSSLTEGTSISLLEAQSCGIPAVVTDVGGNSHVISDGVNGLLCPSGDHAAMADQLHALLVDDSRREQMKIAARRTVLGGFDMQSMVRKYQLIYRDGGAALKTPGAGKA